MTRGDDHRAARGADELARRPCHGTSRDSVNAREEFVEAENTLTAAHGVEHVKACTLSHGQFPRQPRPGERIRQARLTETAGGVGGQQFWPSVDDRD